MRGIPVQPACATRSLPSTPALRAWCIPSPGWAPWYARSWNGTCSTLTVLVDAGHPSQPVLNALFGMQRILEPDIAAMAATTATEADIAVIEEAYQRMEAAQTR